MWTAASCMSLRLAVLCFSCRCALNTLIQFLSGMPGFCRALSPSASPVGSLTSAVCKAVSLCLEGGTSDAALDLRELVDCLVEHPNTRQLVRERERCGIQRMPDLAASAILHHMAASWLPFELFALVAVQRVSWRTLMSERCWRCS